MTAEDLFNTGKQLLADESYLESQKMFDLIKLQFPASQYADDAQFYLAELDYKREKYILAAFSYNLVRRVYPSSEYNKQALYMRSMCYYELSPSYERDQEYTKKAIQSFMEFQSTYPNDSLAANCDAKISEMRNKLASREFSIAELYAKLDDPKAAIVYYDFVLNQYDDTKFYEDSYFGKIRALLKMEKTEEAKSIIKLYKNKFPSGKYNDDFEAMLSEGINQ
jgi:outer membrane protein assembly factor BamD